jgi:hypothetical protein
LGPTQLPIEWVPGALSLGVKRPGREADHSHPSSAEDKNEWVELVSDMMSYITLRGRWCDIIVLNVHAPIDDKDDDIKDSFYEELE